MKVVAVILVAGGLIGAIFSNIKYRQCLEWEHWAEKLTYLLLAIGSSTVAVAGVVMFIVASQPE